ncbi:unnamed protein product [Coregonus sp. 'balchen']|nr:unnamed protein product [Coregonus sp. 'balchen']
MHPEMKITHPAGCMSQFIQFFGEQIMVLVLLLLPGQRVHPGGGRGRTTEKIFEEKRDLYDVYVDNQNVRTTRESLKPLLRLSAADREKYRKLTEQRQMLLYSQEENGDCVSSEEDHFILFFLEQNNRIFQTLSEVAGSPEPILTQESVRAMGLDPHGDRLFLLHLLETYGYDSLLITDQPCCS